MNVRYALGAVLATALALPLLATAQDFTPIGDRILSDPTYLPLQGQFYGQSSYGYERTDGNVFDATGAQSASTRDSTTTLRQGFAFGITDALSVNATMAYASGENRRANSAGLFDFDRNGFDDPSFGATYRLLDQRTHPLSLDLFGSYSPNAFQARSATSLDDGTVARGGSQTDLGLAVGHGTRLFTIRGVFTDRYFGDSSFLNATTGGSALTSSYWVPTLGVQTQTRFTNRLSANVGFDYNFEGSPTVYNSLTGVNYVAHNGDSQNVNVSLNYHFIPNRLVGSIDYQHTFHGQARDTFPATPLDDTLVSRSTNGLGASLRYVFK